MVVLFQHDVILLLGPAEPGAESRGREAGGGRGACAEHNAPWRRRRRLVQPQHRPRHLQPQVVSRGRHWYVKR